MDWVLIAVLSGSLLTSSHSTEEACLGREAILKKDLKITTTKCVDMRPTFITGGTASFASCPGTVCSYGH